MPACGHPAVWQGDHGDLPYPADSAAAGDQPMFTAVNNTGEIR